MRKQSLVTVLVQQKKKWCEHWKGCCCKLLFQLCPLHWVFNWKSGCLPTCPCMPRPPTCLSFRSRSRWSGRASSWPQSSSALLSLTLSLFCSGLPQLDFMKLLRRHLSEIESQFQDRHTHSHTHTHIQSCILNTLRLENISLRTYSVFWACALVPPLVLKRPAIWIVFCSVVLCCDLPQTVKFSFGTSDEQNHVSCSHWPSPKLQKAPKCDTLWFRDCCFVTTRLVLLMFCFSLNLLSDVVHCKRVANSSSAVTTLIWPVFL